MSDFTRSFKPWENFNNGLYLAGAECLIDAEAPECWTKWIIPGYEYICAECEGGDIFNKVISYMNENSIELAGAIHDFTCKQEEAICFSL